MSHMTEMHSESEHEGLPYVIRFKSPNNYPPFRDLLHGELSLQPSI